jgi:hypothetical protein
LVIWLIFGLMAIPAKADNGFFYNTTAQFVNPQTNITFAVNGPTTNVSHTAGSATITLNATGTFLVHYSVKTIPSSTAIQVAAFLGANQIGGANYVGANGEVNGFATFTTAVLGSVVTIRNVGNVRLTLNTGAYPYPNPGPSAATNASVFIQLLP